MTWVSRAATLANPVLDNWSDAERISLQGGGLDESLLDMSGDPDDPRIWLDLDWDTTGASYLASGNGNSRQILVELDIAIMVEPSPDADDLIRQQADLFEGYYQAASGAHFAVNEARLDGPFTWDDGGPQWRRGDWLCPVLLNEDIGDTEEAFLAGQSSNQKAVSQVAHGFAVGDWVGFDGSNWVKADADSQEADGVVSTVTDVDNFTVTTGDIVKVPSHGLTLGNLYLSTTAGAATSTEPDPGDGRQYLGKALDTDYLLVRPGELLNL